jgi:hypothetical protein
MTLRQRHGKCQYRRSLGALRGSCDLASPVHFPAGNRFISFASLRFSPGQLSLILSISLPIINDKTLSDFYFVMIC